MSKNAKMSSSSHQHQHQHQQRRGRPMMPMLVLLLLLLLISVKDVQAGFQQQQQQLRQQQQQQQQQQQHVRRVLLPTTIRLQAAKGFGGSSSSSSSSSNTNKNKSKSKKPPPSSKKQVLKQLEKTYGGTTPQEIARATQQKIDAMLQSQPPHVQLAFQIHVQLTQWNRRVDQMNLWQQTTQIAVEEMEGAKRAQMELDRIFAEHNLSERDLHNLIQQATWDASADAKAARSITGEMPADIQKRVQKGCDVAVQHALNIRNRNNNNNNDNKDKDNNDNTNNTNIKVLDVGCGFGVLVPFLHKAGLKDGGDDQIHGIDLSPEMIRNAQQRYPQCHFQVGDFLSTYHYNDIDTPPPSEAAASKENENDQENENKQEEESNQKFDAILFCSSLHDLPDMMEATLPKAHELLKDYGVCVIMHPQGASHVLNQVRNNPVMVPRGLPTTAELEALSSSSSSLCGFQLLQAPAAPNSREEKRDGYLAVLERIPIPMDSD